MPSYISRETFLTTIRRRERDIPLPDGSLVRVREPMLEDRLAAQEAADIDPESGALRNVPAFYAVLTQRCALGENGTPLFTPDDLPLLTDARTPLAEQGYTHIIGDAAWTLGEARPDDLKSVDAAADPAGDADTGLCAADAGGDAGADGA